MPTKERKTKAQRTSNEAAKRLGDMNLRHQIEKRAYEIWLSSRCSQGNDVAHWFQAENEVLAAVKGAQMRPSEPTCTFDSCFTINEANTRGQRNNLMRKEF